MAVADYYTVVQQLYVAYYGRPADTGALTNFATALNDAGVEATMEGVKQAYGTSAAVKAVVDFFGNAPEAVTLYGSGTVESLVFAIYQNVLNRVPDAEGFKFWCDEINAGRVTRAKAAIDIMAGARVNTSAQGLVDKATVDAKITVAVNFTAAITTQNATYAGDDAAAAARAMLKSVTSTTDTTAFQSTINSTLAAITNPGAGETFTLTTSTTADVLVGTAKNDTFVGVDSATASADTYSNADQVLDQSTTDNDTYNLSLVANATPNATNVENVNVTFAVVNGSNPQLNASALTGVKVLTVTGTDVTVGGASIAGDKDVDVTALNASKVAKVVAGAGTVDVTIAQATKAGVVVDASTATGTIAVTGATALSADAATGTVTVTALGVAAENTKTVTVDAAKASSVSIAAAGADKFSGEITVNAAAATTVTVANATTSTSTGAVTVNAAKATTVTIDDAAHGATVKASTANTAAATITVNGIDDTGATVVAGTGTTTQALTIELGGSTGANDTAAVSAAGVVTLDVAKTTGVVDNVNVSGNGAAVTYTINATTGGVIGKLVVSGDHAVNFNVDADEVDGKTITGAATVKVGSADAQNATDFSKISASTIEIAADFANDAVTLANNAVLNFTAASQTTGVTVLSATNGDAVTLKAGDSNGAANTATPTVTFNAITASGIGAGKGTLNIVATDGNFTATSLTADDGAGDAEQIAVVVSGTKNVVLNNAAGEVKAASVNASNLSGNLTLTAKAGLNSVTGGSGVDTILVNGAVVHNISTAAGNDVVNVLATSNASQFDLGAGNDTIRLGHADAASSIVVVAGDGDDMVKVGYDDTDTAVTVSTDAILVGGAGTDTLKFDTAASAALDLSAKANFSFTGFEKLDITDLDNTLTISAADFAGNATALSLIGTSNDVLRIKAAATGSTIDASTITLATGSAAVVEIETGAKKDTVTGTAGNDTIFTSRGGDAIDGGAGTDTINLEGMYNVSEGTGLGTSNGVIINLGTSAITAASVVGKLGAYLSGSLASVDAGTAAYIFAADATTNSTVKATVSGVENIDGSTGRDYIVGDSANNVIAGMGGADYIDAGAGADTIEYTAAGQTGAVTAGAVTTHSTVGFDVLAGITAGDIIATGLTMNAGAVVADTDFATVIDASALATQAIVVRGTYNAATNTFDYNVAGADAVLYWDDTGTAAGTNNDAVVIVGGGALTWTADAAGNFTAA